MHVVSLDEKTRQRSVSIRNILLATDGSPAAHDALTAAADLARRSGALLHLVTAYDVAPSSVLACAPFIGPDSAGNPFEVDARTVLVAEKGLAVTLGATVGSIHIACEPAFTAVMDMAEIVDADLVVAGSRDLSLVRRLLLGSVSTKLLHAGRDALLVVPEHEPPAR